MPSTLRGPVAGEFGWRLRTLRLEMGLTQSEAARAASMIKVGIWFKLEAGKQNSLNLEMMGGIARLAIEQGISLAWLFGGQEPMRDEPPEKQLVKLARAIVKHAELNKARGRATAG